MLKTLQSILRRTLQVWRGLQPRQRLIAGGVAALSAVLLAYFSFGVSRGCATREDVEARVAIATAELQQAASERKISIEDLAQRIKQINQAAAAYSATKDHQVYCNALDAIGAEPKLTQ